MSAARRDVEPVIERAVWDASADASRPYGIRKAYADAFIQTNRRIFVLESWFAAFLRGQTGDTALGIVRQYLDAHPRLPLDLRRKVLQQMDELSRTVRLQKAERP